ncbi:MAG TPA: ABC transporter permease subunit [Candidatus Poseidoniales archaeon]|nr:ABC transporter permease subunit [Candidatus Poseidoniales archaeon]
MTEDKGRIEGSSVWTSLDRKSVAMIEFTLGQYRRRMSTWVIVAVSTMLIALIGLVYIDDVQNFDATVFQVDNDGDGLFSEDGFDTLDNDEDCQSQTFTIQKDTNGNNVMCDVEIIERSTGVTYIPDSRVDEDPDEAALEREITHRGYVLATAKLGIGFIVPLLLSLFLATNLIRDEIENETMHYISGKPLDRGEILGYRLIAYLIIVWPVIAALCLLQALVCIIIGPSEGMLRFDDIGIWVSAMLAGWLICLAYGALFSVFGSVHRFGGVGALFIGLWETMMGFLTLGFPNIPVTRMSLVRWGYDLVDAAVPRAWADANTLSAKIETVDYPEGFRGEEITTDGLEGWFGGTPFNLTPFLSSVVSVLVLLFFTALCLFIGRTVLSTRELE